MDENHQQRTTLPPLGVSLGRLLVRFLIVLVAAWLIYSGMMWAMTTTEAMLPAGQAAMVKWGLLASVVVLYAVLMAVPFVPGIEIGISLLLIGGAALAPIVYLATVLGLVMAFFAGANLSHDALHRFFADLRLVRVCDLLEQMKSMGRQERIVALERRLPGWLAPYAIRGRYVALALLLNLPGNAAIGGGGGICLLAGLSRMYAPGLTTLTIAIAVLPIPFGVWLYGTAVFTGF